MFKSYLSIILTLIGLSSVTWADAPSVVIKLSHSKTANKLVIVSETQWNVKDPEVGTIIKIKDTDEETVVHGNQTSMEKEYVINGKKVKVSLKFPLREKGRELTPSSRVEVNVNYDGKVIFSTGNFGQAATGWRQELQKPRPSYVAIAEDLNVKYRYENLVDGKSNESEYIFNVPLSGRVDETYMEENLKSKRN